jgi:His/Glu/Gln/Arg/opine family amino acid ABC transporter permease subunit
MGCVTMDFNFIGTKLPALLRGTQITLLIAVCSSLMGLVFGTLLAILHTSNRWFLSLPVTIYVTIVRGTPMLIQIPFFYYLLPTIGIHLPLITTAIIAIGLNSSAYISQTVRAGIRSVPSGQREAARVLGLTSWQTMRYIVLPQALAVIVPALVSEFITLIKDSSLASTIGVVELFKEGTIIISRTYNALPVYAAIAAIYLVLTMTLTAFSHYVERKMRRHVSH